MVLRSGSDNSINRPGDALQATPVLNRCSVNDFTKPFHGIIHVYSEYGMLYPMVLEFHRAQRKLLSQYEKDGVPLAGRYIKPDHYVPLIIQDQAHPLECA